MARRTPPPGRGGTPADRLTRAWLDEDDDAFDALAEEFIAAGRDGVLDAALRKLAEKYEDDAVAECAAALIEVAEVARGGPGFDEAQLVMLPVFPEAGLPDAAAIAAGLPAAGVVLPEARLLLAPGWRLAETIADASPVVLRQALLDILAGRDPAGLPPAPAEALADPADLPPALALVGAILYAAPPPAEEAGDPDAQEAEEAARAEALAAAFDRWADALPEAVSAGAMIQPLCLPSQFAEQMGEVPEDGAAAELIDFVTMAVEEARGETVVARLAPAPDGLAVSLRTRGGRMLDERVFPGGPDGLDDALARRILAEVAEIE
ncbi:hypothetical protein [Paracraurococcus ruber]|uniref:hypothetical protein n=1 Tax=Paracraurococcus ruber TaxID=77675 RepID=UPI0010579F48|nr:hypothetical protein [Paracraurococcus ruber]TDG05920.1 hypothetical protein E2C05_31825 [Paracraurococcus ruber]